MSINPIQGVLNVPSALKIQNSGHIEHKVSSFSSLSESLKHVSVSQNVSESSPPSAANAIDETADSEKRKSALQQLREYMELTPAERIRANLLNEMELTEEELEKLPPEEQEAIERVIAQRIEDTLGKHSSMIAEKADAGTSPNPGIETPQQGVDEAIKLYQAISLTTG